MICLFKADFAVNGICLLMIKYNLKLYFKAKWENIFLCVYKCTEPKALIDSLDCWTFDAKNRTHRWDAAMACSYFLTSNNSIYLQLVLVLFFSTFLNSRVFFAVLFFSFSNRLKICIMIGMRIFRMTSLEH